MSEPHLESLILEPPGAVTACVIWLHGLGADGHDFESLVPELGLRERGVRFILPHAPFQPVTLNGGYVMRAWYDLRWPDPYRETDVAGIQASVAAVNDLIAAEGARGLSPERIVLAGFSQGGAIVLQAGLSHRQRLGGILALSTYLPLPEALTEPALPGRATPVFMAHGREDPVIPLPFAEASYARLLEGGCNVEFHAYRMPHSLCAEEVVDIRAWFERRWPRLG
ncbi:MAG: alpha/beta hydrolase [Gammaproteobacteria bacterium]